MTLEPHQGTHSHNTPPSPHRLHLSFFWRVWASSLRSPSCISNPLPTTYPATWPSPHRGPTLLGFGRLFWTPVLLSLFLSCLHHRARLRMRSIPWRVGTCLSIIRIIPWLSHFHFVKSQSRYMISKFTQACQGLTASPTKKENALYQPLARLFQTRRKRSMTPLLLGTQLIIFQKLFCNDRSPPIASQSPHKP
jgi:hypothetical protein